MEKFVNMLQGIVIVIVAIVLVFLIPETGVWLAVMATLFMAFAAYLFRCPYERKWSADGTLSGDLLMIGTIMMIPYIDGFEHSYLCLLLLLVPLSDIYRFAKLDRRRIEKDEKKEPKAKYMIAESAIMAVILIIVFVIGFKNITIGRTALFVIGMVFIWGATRLMSSKRLRDVHERETRLPWVFESASIGLVAWMIGQGCNTYTKVISWVIALLVLTVMTIDRKRAKNR
jgi:hypothetical protein